MQSQHGLRGQAAQQRAVPNRKPGLLHPRKRTLLMAREACPCALGHQLQRFHHEQTSSNSGAERAAAERGQAGSKGQGAEAAHCRHMGSSSWPSNSSSK